MKIIFDRDDDCIGCPQGCVHCGRGAFRYTTAIICEKCGAECETLYETDEGNKCQDCVLKDMPKITLEYIDENQEKFEDEDWVYYKVFYRGSKK